MNASMPQGGTQLSILAITETHGHHENCEDTIWQDQANRLFDSSEIIAAGWTFALAVFAVIH